MMPNGNIITNVGFRFFIGTMNARAILYIHFVSDTNAIDITPNYGIKPDTTILTHHYIAHYGGIRRYKTRIGYRGSKPLNRKNYWHIINIGI
jgi:hypothetical protein